MRFAIVPAVFLAAACALASPIARAAITPEALTVAPPVLASGYGSVTPAYWVWHGRHYWHRRWYIRRGWRHGYWRYY